VRLVRASPGMVRPANVKFAHPTPAPLAFSDGYPLLVCNQASLEDLNRRLSSPVPMERFRPNLVLTGLPAWAEDRIDRIEVGAVPRDVRFPHRVPDLRNVAATAGSNCAQRTASRDPDPPHFLRAASR